MKSGVPWHIKGVHPDVRDNAREAARRAGMSVGQWLNTVIVDSTADEDEDDEYYYDDSYAPVPRRRPRRDPRQYERAAYDDPPPPLAQAPQDRGPDLTAIADRISGLTEEVERLARMSSTPREPPPPPREDETARKLAEAIAKLDQRIESLVQEGRSATEALGQKVESVDRALSALGRERLQAGASDWAETASTADWASSVDQACDEIARRQRELEGEIFPAAENLGQAPSPRARDDFAVIYDRLKQVSDQVEAFGAFRMRESIDTLRNDLADVAGKLVEASPRRAIEALEGEVRLLASRLDAGLKSGSRSPELASIERGLTEVRDAVRGLTPAESLSGAVDAIRVLSHKIDQMAAGPKDPASFQKMEAAIAGLRGIISNVASDNSLAALTAEVRTLSERISAGLANAGGSDILRNLEQRIGTIADAIETVRVSTANPGSSALEKAVSSLSDKIDQLQNAPAGQAAVGPDIGAMIGSLGEKIDRLNVAPEQLVSSPDLGAMIGSLGEKIDRLQTRPEPASVGPDIGAMIGSLGEKIDRLQITPGQVPAGPDLGAMIGSLGDKIDRLQAAPEPLATGPDLNTLLEALGERIDRIPTPPPVQTVNTDHIVDMIGSLSEKIEGLRATRGDSEMLRQIEDRIGLLSQKLEASEAKLGNLDNIEKGMTELLAYLEKVRGTPVPAPPAPPVEHLVNDVMRTQESLEAAHGTIGDVVDRLAMIETGMRSTGAPPAVPAPPSAPAPPQISSVQPASQQAATAKAGAQRTPPKVDDIHPSDQPLEPGSGKPRPSAGAPAAGSVLDRIAGSKLTAEPARNAAEIDPKASFIVAARRAAQAAAEEAPTPVAPAAPLSAAEKSEAKPRGLFGRHIKSLLVGASVAIIAAGAVHLAFTFLNSDSMPDHGPVTVSDPALSSRPMPPGAVEVGSSGVLNVAPPSTAGANPNAGVLPQPAPAAPNAPTPEATTPPVPERSSRIPALPGAPITDVTGAVVNGLPAAAPASTAPASQKGGGIPALPAAIGSKVLVEAAESGDPTAAYEVATRFADGRGIPLNPEAAATWFERAANAGIVPAMFRLGGLYEKGIGVRKDTVKARDLYVAAAERGSAKAMHNLAVLYADGIDGKPDYAAALQWFRKAGARGVPDSQYNLGVLYARGIGVEQNFGESYRWFALAAQAGDQDAAQKRDDIAKRLDSQTLNAVRAAVQKWTPEPQPDDAVLVKSPPGGWDATTPAPAPSPKGKAKRV